MPYNIPTQVAKVSVIMSAYNSATYIAEAIESIVAQTFPLWDVSHYQSAPLQPLPFTAANSDMVLFSAVVVSQHCTVPQSPARYIF